ncbi:MAG: HAMP domain-containing protein, partial [Rhodospirillaceae bacterium]|nr:HAMP domain-containing protein [Rhodospirillales bacterium]
MANKTSGLTVKGRIYGGFSTVLLLLLAVAGVGIYGFTTIGTNVDRYATVAGATSRLQTIERNVVDLRRNAYVYSQEGTDTALARVRELQPTLRKDLTEAVAGATSPERKATLEQMLRLFEQYSANFEKIAALKGRTDKQIQDSLVPAGTELSKILSSLIENTITVKDWDTASYAGRAQDQVSSMRLISVKFLADPDHALIDKFKQQSINAEKSLKVLLDTEKDLEHRRLIEPAVALLPNYERTFLDVSVAMLEIERLTNKENAVLAAEFGSLGAKTRESAVDAMEGIRDATQTVLSGQEATAMVVSAIALALGLAFAYLIARSILVPITNMTDSMGELAGGKLDITVPALERTDEIGSMAQAVQVFKQNAVDKQRMEQEAEAARIA